jgi:hypothetical protein
LCDAPGCERCDEARRMIDEAAGGSSSPAAAT